jgi:hypothetical protein
MMTKEQREQGLAEVAGVDAQTRLLMLLVSQGHCPFCLGSLDRDSAAVSAVRRGLTGASLKTAIDNAKARDAADGIDHDTGHTLDCALMEAFRRNKP